VKQQAAAAAEAAEREQCTFRPQTCRQPNSPAFSRLGDPDAVLQRIEEYKKLKVP